MKQVKDVSATFSIHLNYTESVQEMIDDGTLKTKKDVEQYLVDCMMEDVSEVLSQHDFNIAELVKTNIK